MLFQDNQKDQDPSHHHGAPIQNRSRSWRGSLDLTEDQVDAAMREVERREGYQQSSDQILPLVENREKNIKAINRFVQVRAMLCENIARDKAEYRQILTSAITSCHSGNHEDNAGNIFGKLMQSLPVPPGDYTDLLAALDAHIEYRKAMTADHDARLYRADPQRARDMGLAPPARAHHTHEAKV